MEPNAGARAETEICSLEAVAGPVCKIESGAKSLIRELQPEARGKCGACNWELEHKTISAS